MRTRELEIGNYEPSPKIEKEGIKKEEEEEEEEEEQVVTYSKNFQLMKLQVLDFLEDFIIVLHGIMLVMTKSIITTDWTLEIVAKT